MAFITDFKVDIPTSEAIADVSKTASSMVASPKLHNAQVHREGGAELLFSPQGQVYKVSKPSSAGSFSSLSVSHLYPFQLRMQTRQVKSYFLMSEIFAKDDQSPDVSVRFFAPKRRISWVFKGPMMVTALAFFDRREAGWRLARAGLVFRCDHPATRDRAWSWMLTQPRLKSPPYTLHRH